MALTQVSSGGVKDNSIINADVKSDAAIAGSKLADDSIAEAIVAYREMRTNAVIADDRSLQEERGA